MYSQKGKIIQTFFLDLFNSQETFYMKVRFFQCFNI